MDPLTKVRIELLDENTGNPITEVDAITSSETILYTNPNPMPAVVGSIEKGTTFNSTPLKTILDGILYAYTKPTISQTLLDNGDVPNSVISDEVIIKERHQTVPSFNYTVTVENGTSTTLSCILKVYKDDSTVDQQTAQVNSEVGKQYNFTFNVPELTMNSTIEVTVSDGTNNVIGPYIRYKFVDPIYVGFASSDILTDYGELIPDNIDKIITYFEGMIENPDVSYLDVRHVDISDQYGVSYDVDYDHKQRLHPFILIPTYWGNALAILDPNQLNILKSYSIISGVNLNIYGNEVISYILYVHRGTFDIDMDYISKVKYCFVQPASGPKYPNLNETTGKGIPLSASFDVQYEVPIDSRFVVHTYADLLGVKFPYNGLLTYVEDIDTFFRYKKGSWFPTSTRVYVVEDTSVLTSEMGGWDDVAICTNGTIYRKRYNNVWEEWGKIGQEEETPIYPYLRFNEEYNPDQFYQHNDNVIDLVYHEGSTYYCKQSCTGITPSDDKVHWTYFAKGCKCNSRGILLHNLNTGENIPIEEVIARNIETQEIIPSDNIAFKEVSQ